MKKWIIIISSLIGIFFLSAIYFLEDRKVYFELNGKKTIDINIGEEYKEDGFSAKYCTKHFKLFCKDIKKKVVIKKDNKKEFYKTFITYTLIYKKYNNTLVRTINYKDLESPVIILIDNGSKLCPNEEYIEEGYHAYDNIDGDITDKVVRTVENNKVIYSVSDTYGNKKIVFRKINYKDEIAPELTLVGGDKQYLFINQDYYDNGFSASDNCDGDITDKVIVNNTIDINKTGEYKVEYNVSDKFGNKTTKSKTVVVYDDISKVPKNGKSVYLTFDDGPCIYTERILKTLNKYNVKATFFVTNQFSGYQNLIKQEYDSGHTIAVHTYSHNYDYVYSSVDSYVNDFNQMNEIIKEQTGGYSNIFRFPGGSSNTISRFNVGVVTDIANKMSDLGYYYFDWNVDSNDTGSNDPNVIFENVKYGMETNKYSVVLMHDIKEANIKSVDKIIRYGLNNGYTFLPLSSDSPTVHHKINN